MQRGHSYRRKINMRHLILVLLLLGTWSDIRATTTHSSRCDANCTRIVKRLLQESALGISTGYGEKQNYRLGDKVAVALLKIYGERGIVKSKNIKVFLPVIRAAFLHPDLISNLEDRSPTVTLRFLRDLESKVKDPALKGEISEAIAFVLEHTKDSSLK